MPSTTRRRAAEVDLQASLVAERQGRWVLARRYAEMRETGSGPSATPSRWRGSSTTSRASTTRSERRGRRRPAAGGTRSVRRSRPRGGGRLCPELAGRDPSRARRARGSRAGGAAALELLDGRLDHVQEIGTAQLVLARAHLEQGELDAAEEILAAVDESYARTESISHLARSWMTRGELELERRNDAEAARLYREAATALQPVDPASRRLSSPRSRPPFGGRQRRSDRRRLGRSRSRSAGTAADGTLPKGLRHGQQGHPPPSRRLARRLRVAREPRRRLLRRPLGPRLVITSGAVAGRAPATAPAHARRSAAAADRRGLDQATVRPMDIDDRLQEYAESVSTRHDPRLAALSEETHRSLGSGQMLTGPVAGRFLEILAWTIRPRRVLEIGTFSGHATLSMAAGSPRRRPHRHVRARSGPRRGRPGAHRREPLGAPDHDPRRACRAHDRGARRPLRPRLHGRRQGRLHRLLRGRRCRASQSTA